MRSAWMSCLLVLVVACHPRDPGSPPCAAGLSQCGDTCVELSRTADHCGACGRRCGVAETCANSECQPAGVDAGEPADAAVEERPDASTPVMPELVIDPGALDLGLLEVGGELRRTVRITNAATAAPGQSTYPLLLTSHEVSGSDAFRFEDGEPFPAGGLMPGDSWKTTVVFAPRAAGPQAATLIFRSSDPDEPTAEVRATGEALSLPACDIELLPATLDFGTVAPGGTRTRSLFVVNRSRDAGHDCIVRHGELGAGTAPAFAVLRDAGWSSKLAPGQALELQVRFAPTTEGAFAGTLALRVSDSANPMRTVALSGASSADGCLTASAELLDFGTRQLGCGPASGELIVTNACAGQATIELVAFSGQDSSAFRLTTLPSLPLTLAGGAELRLQVEYTPAAASLELGDLEIRTSAVTPLRLVTQVVGHGRDAMRHEVAPMPRQQVDALFVVDDSDSMRGTAYANVLSELPSVATTAIGLGVDFHFAVTTSSMCPGSATCMYPNGRFVPVDGSRPRIITPATPNPAQALRDNLAVGSGDTTEAMMAALIAALSPALLQSDNANFLRPTANLAVVAVTDVSLCWSQVPVWLENLKGRGPNSVSLMVLSPAAPAEPACVLGANALQRDPAIPSSPPLMKDVERILFRGEHRVFLAEKPNLTVSPPVTVTIDGVPAPEVSAGGLRQWTYEPDANAVRFEPSFSPEAGMVIELTYRAVCP